MTGYILRRLFQLVPVVFGLTLVVFVIVRLVPGDPVQTILGTNAEPEVAAAVRARLGLDRSILDQYLIFLTLAVQGDLGFSYYYHADALSIVLSRVGFTLTLMLYSVLLTVVIAVPLGVLSAVRRDTRWDHGTWVALVLGNSIPRYWLGMVFILVFALAIPIFPISAPHEPFPILLYALFLPALTTAIGQFPPITRALRSNLIESMQADFVYTARAKGLPRRVVFMQHAFRTSLIPAITLIGANISFLVGGQIVVEAVFGLPGLGSLMLKAISARDYPIVQACVFVFAGMVVMVNLVTDVVVAYLDPRIRLTG